MRREGRGSTTAVELRESNPAATTVEEFTNAIDRTNRAEPARSEERCPRGRRSATLVANRTAHHAGGPRRGGNCRQKRDVRGLLLEVPEVGKSFMTERVSELRAILADVRARWQRRALLAPGPWPALTAGAMVFVGVLAVWLVASEGVPLVLVVAAVTAVALTSLVFALLSLRQTPSDRQIARYIEERAGGLDDVLVTAVDKSHEATPIAGVIVGDAVRAARDSRCRAHCQHARAAARRAGRARRLARVCRVALVFRAVGGPRHRRRGVVPVSPSLRHRRPAGLDQGPRRRAGDRRGADSRRRRRGGPDADCWPRRRGAVGTNDARRSVGRIHADAQQHHRVVPLRRDGGFGAVGRVQGRGDQAGAHVEHRRPLRLSGAARARAAYRRRRRRHFRARRHHGAAHDRHRQAGGAAAS